MLSKGRKLLIGLLTLDMAWLILCTLLPYASCQAHAPHPSCLFCWKMWIWHLPLQRHKGPPLAHGHRRPAQRTGTGSSWPGTSECVHQKLSNAVWMLTSPWEKSESLSATPNLSVLLVRASVTVKASVNSAHWRPDTSWTCVSNKNCPRGSLVNDACDWHLHACLFFL